MLGYYSINMYCTNVFSYAVFFSCIVLVAPQTIRDADSKASPISKFACEDDVANLDCPLNTTIEIHSLFYGRNPEHGLGICLNGAPQGGCEMIGFDKEEKLYNLKKACNGKMHCVIIANDHTFGDRQKCPNITKYLNIIYKCQLPPNPSAIPEPSTKEPVYYTGTSRPGTSTKPTAEPYMDLHKLDEDGKKWPTPRPLIKCNTTTESSDDVYLNSASSSKPFLSFIIAIFIWKLFS